MQLGIIPYYMLLGTRPFLVLGGQEIDSDRVFGCWGLGFRAFGVQGACGISSLRFWVFQAPKVKAPIKPNP